MLVDVRIDDDRLHGLSGISPIGNLLWDIFRGRNDVFPLVVVVVITVVSEEATVHIITLPSTIVVIDFPSFYLCLSWQCHLYLQLRFERLNTLRRSRSLEFLLYRACFHRRRLCLCLQRLCLCGGEQLCGRHR